jgi:gamma-glutamyltranspeptidase / glutathione hydrolase
MRLKHVALFVVLLTRPILASPTLGKKGMVATAHPLATAAGVEIMRAGGNAVDAAVGSAFALAVVEPYYSGIGGGGFALIKTGPAIQFFDFREVAPKNATTGMFSNNVLLARDGALAAAVPGAVKGYVELQQRYGKISRAKVLAPAIRLAQKGFPVDGSYLKATKNRLDVLQKDPEAAKLFLRHDTIPEVGTIIVQDDLAKTLRAISKNGSKAFYEGAIAEQLVKDSQTRGGLLTLEDLKQVHVREHAPLVGSYHGHAIVSAPPPSSGGAILLTILNVLESLPDNTPWHDANWLHTYLEASTRAYADRELLGDPNYVKDIDSIVKQLISKERVANLRKHIKAKASIAQDVSPAQGTDLKALATATQPGKETHTSNLSVVDKDGNAVEITTTLNYYWGAGFVAKGTGVVMNDEMDDFASAPGVANAYGIVGSQANRVEPGKVPLSSMTPTFVFEGNDINSPLRMSIGSVGGSKIPTSVTQAIVNYLDFGVDIEKAINLGRIHHQHLPDVAIIEPQAVDPATIKLLESMGHKFKEQPQWSNTTGIAIDPTTGMRSGAADIRGIGCAMAE